MGLALSSFRASTLWRSSAVQWCHDTSPWRHMNENSSASSSPSAIGGHTCGGDVFWYELTISLNFLLDQRLATIPQHHWVGKLLGFDFSVEYKAGSTNTVADALSRCDTEELAVLAISGPRFDFINHLR